MILLSEGEFVESFLKLHNDPLEKCYPHFSNNATVILESVRQGYRKFVCRGWETNYYLMSAFYESMIDGYAPVDGAWIWLYPDLFDSGKGKAGYSPIEYWLKKKLAQEGYYMEFNRRDLLIGSGLEVDIYLPFQKAGIEVNGEKFHAKGRRKDARGYHSKKWSLAIQSDVEIAFVWGKHFQWNRTQLIGLKPGVWELIDDWLQGQIPLPIDFLRVE